MSENAIVDAQARFASARDQAAMKLSRSQVVTRARHAVMPKLTPANDREPNVA